MEFSSGVLLPKTLVNHQASLFETLESFSNLGLVDHIARAIQRWNYCRIHELSHAHSVPIQNPYPIHQASLSETLESPVTSDLLTMPYSSGILNQSAKSESLHHRI